MLQPDTTVQGSIQEPATIPAGTIQSTPNISSEEFEAIKKALEDSKKEISGLNRKNTEYEKAIQQKELEKLSEQDRAKAELELIKQEKLKTEAEIKEISLARVIDTELFNAGITPEFAKRIKGETPEEIKADIKLFKEQYDKDVNALVEKKVNEALGGKPPATGGTPSGSLRQQLINQYNEAEKKGDGAAMFSLKEHIRKLPKE